MNLSTEQLTRYSRNILLEDFGREGQEKLLKSNVLVIGAGGLGSSVLYYLSAAGVGNIGIVDSDKVDLSNLQRQIIHKFEDIGRLKTESSAEKIKKLNSDIKIKTYAQRFTLENGLDIVKDYDFVIDATDNFLSKFLINDICVKANKVFSHAGCVGYAGQTMTVIPGQTACYRCVFQDMPNEACAPSSLRDGILGAVPGILGSIQATEAIKYFLGFNELLTDQLLTFNIRTMAFRKISLKRQELCKCRDAQIGRLY